MTILFVSLGVVLLYLFITKANLFKTTSIGLNLTSTFPFCLFLLLTDNAVTRALFQSKLDNSTGTNVSFSAYESICGNPTIKPVISGFNTRIMNGENAVANSWPWMVSIRYYANGKIYGHFCGGTLITEYHGLY